MSYWLYARYGELVVRMRAPEPPAASTGPHPRARWLPPTVQPLHWADVDVELVEQPGAEVREALEECADGEIIVVDGEGKVIGGIVRSDAHGWTPTGTIWGHPSGRRGWRRRNT